MSRMGYNWNNVFVTKLVGLLLGGLISRRAYNWDFMVCIFFVVIFNIKIIFGKKLFLKCSLLRTLVFWQKIFTGQNCNISLNGSSFDRVLQSFILPV